MPPPAPTGALITDQVSLIMTNIHNFRRFVLISDIGGGGGGGGDRHRLHATGLDVLITLARPQTKTKLHNPRGTQVRYLLHLRIILGVPLPYSAFWDPIDPNRAGRCYIMCNFRLYCSCYFYMIIQSFISHEPPVGQLSL